MTPRFLVLPLLLVLLVLTGGAAYAGGEVVVSADGHSWAASLTAPLFDPAVRWVPGDSRTATFYVGNRSADAGTLAVVARAAGGTTPDPVLGDDLGLQVRRGTGAWTQLAIDGQPHRLSGRDLAAGADERITIRATFAASAQNPAQLRRLPLAFDVELSESATEVAGPTHGGHGGVLPDTGGVQRYVLIAGLFLIVAGATVLRSALRPTDEKDDDEYTRL